MVTVTEHEGGLNLGCDALAVEGCYGGCHPLPSLPDLYSATTAEESSDDGPSISPMAIEEPASCVRDARSSDDILGGILDSSGGGSAAGDCRWCALVRGCGDVEKGRGEKMRSTPRSLQTVCQGGRLPLFGVMATFLILVVVAVVIYCSAVKNESEIPVSFIGNGREVVVLGRGSIVPDVIKTTRNLTAESEAQQLRLFLAQSIEYKLVSLVKKTKFREAYRGFQIRHLSLRDGTFEYTLTFRSVEEEDDFLDNLKTDFAPLADVLSSAEFSVFLFDITSLQSIASETTTDAEVTDVPNETIFNALCEVDRHSRICYPNVLHHRSQEEAVAAALANIQFYFSPCGDGVQRLWCSVFAPDCADDGTPLPPCRSLCQAVFTDCPNLRGDIEYLLSGDCSSLPEKSESSCTDVHSILSPTDAISGSSAKCKAVEADQCRSLGFASTSTAGNLLGQSTTSSLHWWHMLRFVAENSQCSPHLLTFGCSVLFPRCEEEEEKEGEEEEEEEEEEEGEEEEDEDDEDPGIGGINQQPKILGPCHDLCLAVKRDCDFFFSLVGMRFLADFNCSLYFHDADQPDCTGVEGSSASSDHECKEDQFRCDADQCISAKWICDGRRDCSNGLDEEHCAKCPEESFRCSNGRCIPNHRRCDGTMDCYHGDDEDACLRVSTELGSENLLQIYKPRGAPGWETVCLSSTDADKIADSLCNVNRFVLIGSDESDHGDDNNLVVFINRSSNCYIHLPTAVNCSYNDCTDGPRLDEATGLSESSRFGATLADGDWPWLVSLHGGRRKTFYCGGVLIDAQWVVTAAHCVGSLTERDDWSIVAGQSRRTSSSASAWRQERRVGRLIVHPRYAHPHNASGREDDIALVRLDRPVEFSARVRRLCLPDARRPDYQPTPGQVCYVGGWGKTTDADSDFSEELRLRRLTVEAVTHCDEGTTPALADDGRSAVICTTGRLADDVCKGDSGSAVLCEDDGGNGRLVFAGIVSRGRECGYPDVSSVQTAIGPFTDWIRHEISSSSSSSGSFSSSSSSSSSASSFSTFL